MILQGCVVRTKQEYRRVLHTNQRYRWNGKTPNRLLLPARVEDVGLRHTVLVRFSVRRYQLFHSTIASVPNSQKKCWDCYRHTHISSLDILTLHSWPFVPALPIPAEQLNTDWLIRRKIDCHTDTANPRSSQRLSGWCRLLSFHPISHGRSSLQD